MHLIIRIAILIIAGLFATASIVASENKKGI